MLSMDHEAQSESEKAKIKAEIERLEKALRDCTDSGIRGVIQDWIADARKRLASVQKSK
jgi:hypothetical protein